MPVVREKIVLAVDDLDALYNFMHPFLQPATLPRHRCRAYGNPSGNSMSSVFRPSYHGHLGSAFEHALRRWSRGIAFFLHRLTAPNLLIVPSTFP